MKRERSQVAPMQAALVWLALPCCKQACVWHRTHPTCLANFPKFTQGGDHRLSRDEDLERMGAALRALCTHIRQGCAALLD